MFRIATLCTLALSIPVPGFAQDYESMAEERMQLSFDIEAVEGELDRRAKRPAPRVDNTRVAAPKAPLPLEPNSQVASVTVFRDRALITRTRGASLKPGVHTLTFQGLPPAMLDDSLVATARGATLLGVEVTSGQGEVDQARQDEIEEELRTHLDALGAVRDRIEALLAQRTALRRAVLAQGQEGPPPVREIQALLTFVDESEQRLARALREQEDEAKELDEIISPLLVKLNNPNATGKSVQVQVRVAQDAQVELDLRYAVIGAGWTPSYDLRYDPDSDELTIGYVGVVAQGTGEVWADAPISLSTASPDLAGALPDLDPWRLGEGWVGPGLSQQVGALGPSTERPGAGSSLISEDLDAVVADSGTVVFRLPGERTVVGDGSAQRLPLGVQRYAVEPTLIAAPRAVDRVFREGQLQLAGSVPILPGPAHTYVGGQLVGTGPVARTLPGERLKLSLGTDDRVRVTRRITERHRDISGRKHRYSFRFELEVTNPAERARTITLRDLVPISEDADIDVRMLEGTPPETRDDGELCWTVQVPPGQSRTVTFGFTVVAPSDRTLSDLEAMLL